MTASSTLLEQHESTVGERCKLTARCMKSMSPMSFTTHKGDTELEQASGNYLTPVVGERRRLGQLFLRVGKVLLCILLYC